MINQLKRHYPNAIVQTTLPNFSHCYSFYIESEKKYIAVPKADVTPSELQLLNTIFPLQTDQSRILFGEKASEWQQFLFYSDSEPPSEMDGQEYRIIQLSISEYKEQFELKDLQEAFINTFSLPVTQIFTSPTEGIIVEKNHPLAISEQDLSSSIQAFESDFYFKIHFFIGQFRQLDYSLKRLFELEKRLFQFALQEKANKRIHTFANVLPSYLLKNTDITSRKLLFNRIFEVFQEDIELKKTIKLYLENHSNTSQTAKQLFMHRNSLQYKLDKFLEKTGVDIKSFSGAITAYLACLDYEGNEPE
ncbi:helix-turn-helix domain-containing protein [Bacillus sp. FJAT-49736]|uniref:PucR family transcriptional regulator n=1 Tax=Bacillus sp. FJAT-49736 TaxID=2833582 RepID=UPI001BC8EF3C|nr:helix-turn-helix domain-containing protein [Bacillus sp. FJAT-49736]MBS4171871.1 helix-turn-helix domain-containing protein [Bacillus sp. FJAT-49736]